MTTYHPGQRVEVSTNGTWIPATVLTTYPGHGGALVLPDSWAQHVWAKPEELRTVRRDYEFSAMVLVRTKAWGDWVEASFDKWEDSTRERAYVHTREHGTIRVHHTNIKPIGDKPPAVNVVDFPLPPHEPSYERSFYLSKDEIAALAPYRGAFWRDGYGRDTNGTFTKPKGKDASETCNVVGFPVLKTQIPNRAEYLDATLGHVGVDREGQRKFIDIMAEFAKCGIDPDQLSDYVEAFARIIVQGSTPEELHDFAHQTLLNRHQQTGKGLHHIAREYGN